MVKKYCKNCKYFGNWAYEECNALQNIEWKDKYDFIHKVHIEYPKFINENNDCKWYQEKWRFKTIVDFFKYIARIK